MTHRSLYLKQGVAWSSGCAQYDVERDGTVSKMIVSARCRLGRQRTSEWALLDTGAHWSVISGEIAASLGDDFHCVSDERVAMSTRLGVFHGRFHRLDVTLEADEGEDLQVEASVLVLPEWPGPSVVLGYRGFLERVRFGLDPGVGVHDQWMFFGAADGRP